MRAVLLFVLFSTPCLAARRVVVFAIEPSEPALAKLAASATQQLETELAREPRLGTVLGQRDVITALGLERQRALLGCESSCATEIAAALDADWLVGGTLAGAGERLRLDLKVVRLRDAVAVWRDGRTFVDPGTLFPLLTELADDAKRVLVPVTPSRSPVPWVLMGAGVAAAAGGVTAIVVARSDFETVQARVSSGQLSPELGRARTAELNTIIVGGSIAAAVGGALLASGLVWRLAEPPPVTPLAVVTRDGVVFSLGGSF